MKNVLFVMALFLGTQAFAQGGIESKKIFVRVYNLKGNKIGKGKILSFSDDALISSSLATGSGILMGATGAAVGGLTALFKKVETYSIDGDAGKWTSFQTDMGYIE